MIAGIWTIFTITLINDQDVTAVRTAVAPRGVLRTPERVVSAIRG